MSAPEFPSNQPDPELNPAERLCPVTGRVLKDARPRSWVAWLFSGMGLFSLVWFLVRVIPKPSRATYPCQRVAFPLAGSFVVWVTAVLGSAFAWRKARMRGRRFWKACLWGAGALAGGVLVVTSIPTLRAWAGNPPHGPLGVAKGLFPGRVAWVYAPQATSWAGYTSSEHWYETNHTDLAVVEAMMSKAVQSVGGGSSDAAAWDAIFKYFNQNHGKGQRGYQAGENIAIKINLTTCNARSGTATVDINGTYEKQNAYSDGHWLNTIDNSPQLLLSLLRHLVYTVGVGQTNIFLGDPTGNFPQYMWNKLHSEFPNVHYFDNYGGSGRMRTVFSAVPFFWSVTNAAGTVQQDYIPVPFAQADYIIDFAVLKGHSVGVTVCGKNLYGSLLRCPDGYYRDANGANQGAILNYSSMHTSTPDPNIPGTPGMGHYRAIVDLLGHPALGGKLLLCLVDGLYGGYFWDSHPQKWNMPPFNGNWPSSLFASQDPVAIDSVCYDFLLNEWPNVVNNGSTTADNALQGGAEDYLHEAALAANPPSGTFYDPAKSGTRLASLGVHEHWNDATNKQYSRNLGTGPGIELVALTAVRPDPLLAINQGGNQAVVSWQASLAMKLQSSTNLAVSNAWSDVSTLPALIQGRNAVTNDTSDPNRFYRLAPFPPPPPPAAPTYGNGGNPWTINASGTTRIEAENYDTGAPNVAYYDTTSGNSGGQYRSDDVDIEATTDVGAGYDVGWLATGEWLTYTVTVPSAGTYNLSLRVARQPTGNGTVQVSFGGVDKTGAMSVPSTGGWQTWTTITATNVSLSAGQQVMRVNILSDNFNLNWIELSR